MRIQQLVNDFSVDDLVDRIEMGNLERSNRLDRQNDNLFGITRRRGIAQAFAGGPKRAQHLCAVEPLTLTVVTEAHNAYRLSP